MLAFAFSRGEVLIAIDGWNMPADEAPGDACCVMLPLGITTTIGFALPEAMRLSIICAVRPSVVHASSSPPAPCRR